MPSGFKIADAYVSVTLDRDQLRSDIVGLPGDVGAEVDAAGKSIGRTMGDEVGKGLGDGIGNAPISEPSTRKGTEAGDRFGSAMSSKIKAALAALPPVDMDLNDEFAQAKLDYIRDELTALSSQRVGVDISDTDALAKLTYLRAQLDDLAAASASIQVKADTAAASAELDKFFAATEVKADVAGKAAGDKMSKGMADATRDTSPLIVAAIAGGLLAGAPVLLGAAGIMFAGIAAAAVHSNEQVQQAFATTKSQISSTFTDSAQVAVPFFVSALQRIGSAVQALGPQLHTAFAALGGPIDSLTTGIIALANNAMPGLVSAVQNAGPVFEGLSSLLAEIGTGIGQMFQIMSEHSSAAGTVLSSLGSILSALLPILGQLVGAGAELGAQILPPVAAVLHLVADALNLIAPVLPTVVAGFVAFKAVGLLSGPLELLSAKLQTVAADAEGMGGKLAGSAASGVSGMSSALPALGAAVGFVAVAYETWTAAADEAQKSQLLLGKALNEGGVAAQGATQAMKTYNDSAMGGLLNSLPEGITSLKLFGHSLDDLKMNAGTADAAFKSWYNSLTPLEQKQYDVTASTDDLQQAIKKYGENSGQAAGAAVDLKDKQQALTDAQNALLQATHGVTQAMLDEASEALAAADSGFALQRATLASKDAQLAMLDAIKKHGAASEEAQKATLDFNQALLQQAEAAGKAAADQSGLTDKTELTKVSNQATLKSLLDLKAQYGAEFPAALQQTIDRLQAAGVTLDDVGAKKPTPTVDANTGPLNAKVLAANGELGNLNAQRPTPIGNLNIAPLLGMNMQGLNNLAILAGQRPTPSAFLNDYVSGAARAAQAVVDSMHGKTITLNTVHNDIYSGGKNIAAATGGQVGAVISGAAKRFDVGGKISGPGGPTDDLIPAITYAGIPLRVSNEEWIIPGTPSAKYGDQKMAAIVAGSAIVSLPAESRGYATGGSASQSASSGSSITVQGGITLSFPNVTTIADPKLPRQLVVAMREGIRKLDSEDR